MWFGLLFLSPQCVYCTDHLTCWVVLPIWFPGVYLSLESRKSVFIWLLREFYSLESSVTFFGLYDMHECKLHWVRVALWHICAFNVLKIMVVLCYMYALKFLTVVMTHWRKEICQLFTVIMSLCYTYKAHARIFLISLCYVRMRNMLTAVVTFGQHCVYGILPVVLIATPSKQIWVCIRWLVWIMLENNEK